MIMTIICMKSIEIAFISNLDVQTSIDSLQTIDNDIHSHYKSPSRCEGLL